MFLDKLQRRPPAVDPILHLHAALEKISTAKSLNALSEMSLKEALSLVEADTGSFFLVDEEKKEFVLKGASGEYLSYFPGVRRKLDEGILGYVANRQAPLLVQDVRKDSRFRNGNGFSHYKTPSFLSLPILLRGKLMGIVNLTDKRTRHPFSAKDLEWMTLLAHCIAMNIERIYLATELKQRHDAAEEERRQLEAQLELSKKMASIGKLAAGIAHELNNPLDGTLRYIHLSLRHLREGDVVREYLLEVKQGLNRMVNIVRNLLAFSRRQHIAPKPVDVNEVLEETLCNLTDALYPTGIHIIKAYHPDLPLLLDRGMDQIFTNIIKNAIEAMSDGGLLKIATFKNEQELLVRISDTGHGISRETKPYIFDPFFTTKEIDKGCGLGLSICDELIQGYEGRIEVESEEHRGTTFLLRFPLKYAVSRETVLSYAG